MSEVVFRMRAPRSGKTVQLWFPPGLQLSVLGTLCPSCTSILCPPLVLGRLTRDQVYGILHPLPAVSPASPFGFIQRRRWAGRGDGGGSLCFPDFGGQVAMSSGSLYLRWQLLGGRPVRAATPYQAPEVALSSCPFSKGSFLSRVSGRSSVSCWFSKNHSHP